MEDDIEMDEEQEQEQEQEPIEEPDYDDQDDDEDDEDDMEDDDADGDADDDDDDDDGDADDDADDASVTASRNGALRRSAQDQALSAATYLRKVQERRKLFHPSPACIQTPLGYQIEPMAAAPHAAHIHAMALSLDGQTLLTGGSDGFVRKYDVHATMNGKTMLTQNVRHGFVEGITRGGTLTAFWPNEEQLPTNGASSSSLHNPPIVAEKDRLVGVVHSLAIQQDALWGLSGSESGNIHLYGVRHEPGVTRHVFRKHRGAVSALALTSDETTMISGGWDRDVHQWDLNTGQVIRSFPGNAGQISSLSFRPYPSASSEASPSVSIHHSAARSDRGEVDEDAEDKVRNEGMDVTGEVRENGDDGERKEERSAPRENGGASKEASPDNTVLQTDDAPPTAAASSEVSKSGKNGAGENATTVDMSNGREETPEKSRKDDKEASDASVSDPNADATSDSKTSHSNSDTIQAATTSDRQENAVASEALPADNASTHPASGAAAASEVKKETVDPSAPSSSTLTGGAGGGGGDDPTEEELAFEAELNASLGMSLDGSGATKADGTRPDSLTAGASGTTAGGLMVAGADQDLDNDGGDDDLFGGDTPPPSSATKEGQRKEDGDKADADGAGAGGNESDGNDSLFGDGDEDADGDAEMDADADADADAEADVDAEGDAEEEDEDEDEGSSDEDMPLAGRAMVKNASSQSNLVAGASGTPGPASTSASLSLPSTSDTTKANDTPAANGEPTDSTSASTGGGDIPAKKPLPKPAFGGFNLAASFSAPLSTFSRDVMLSTSLSGQVILWDLRCPTYTTGSGESKGVHSLPLPAKVPPWSQSAIFNSLGDKVFVGRRNESVDEWDLRMPTAPHFIRSLRLPSGSGPVYSLAPMPNARHILCGSYDNIRLWDHRPHCAQSHCAGNVHGDHWRALSQAISLDDLASGDSLPLFGNRRGHRHATGATKF